MIANSPSQSENQTLRIRVHLRTHELAGLAGRIYPQVTQLDYETAKREVTGERDLARQNRKFNTSSPSAPIRQRRQPVLA